MASFSRSRWDCCRTFSAAASAKRASRLITASSATSVKPPSDCELRIANRETVFIAFPPSWLVDDARGCPEWRVRIWILLKRKCMPDFQCRIYQHHFLLRNADDTKASADRITALHVVQILAALILKHGNVIKARLTNQANEIKVRHRRLRHVQ